MFTRRAPVAVAVTHKLVVLTQVARGSTGSLPHTHNSEYEHNSPLFILPFSSTIIGYYNARGTTFFDVIVIVLI